MKEAIERDEGFDVIVVVSSNGNSRYWEWRLSATREGILSKKTKIICTEEDWDGGAGQLLGTIYALEKANEIINLKRLLKNGGTVAIYHTAGYGKRMAPLCGTEGNNKPAVKLPKPIKFEGGETLLNMLEAVLLSTQAYAKSREGRVCVFWGDQIIIPSRTVRRETRLPVEIFGIKERISLSPREWRKNWQTYGILIPKKGKGILQREKLTWEEIKKLQEKGHLIPNQKGKVEIAKSMGCFSVNLPFLLTLLKEFSKELELKKRKLDTDEHLWMPLSSTKGEYVAKGESLIYWQRIKKFKKKFQDREKIKVLLGEKNLGKDTLWWDYGNLAFYQKNLLVLLEDSGAGKAAREFYDLEKYLIKKEKTKNLKIKNSILINAEIEKGEIKDSIIINSKIKRASLERGIVINSQVKGVKSRNILIYNLNDEKRVKAYPNEVITDIVVSEGTKIRMRTSLLRDSKKDWKIRLPQNPFSYSEIERCLARLANQAFKVRL